MYLGINLNFIPFNFIFSVVFLVLKKQKPTLYMKLYGIDNPVFPDFINDLSEITPEPRAVRKHKSFSFVEFDD